MWLSLLLLLLPWLASGCTRLGFGADRRKIDQRDARSDSVELSIDSMLDGLVDGASEAPITGCQHSCSIDVTNGTHDCEAPIVAEQLGGGRGRFVVDLDGCSTLAIVATFCDAAAWSLHIGNSSTNNGFGGDAGTFSNDSELFVVSRVLYVHANDDHPTAGKLLQTIGDYVPAAGCVERRLTISDGRVFGGQGLDVTSEHVFRLNQPDSEGPVDALLYIGLNRVFIDPTDRTGSGLTKLLVSVR